MDAPPTLLPGHGVPVATYLGAARNSLGCEIGVRFAFSAGSPMPCVAQLRDGEIHSSPGMRVMVYEGWRVLTLHFMAPGARHSNYIVAARSGAGNYQAVALGELDPTGHRHDTMWDNVLDDDDDQADAEEAALVSMDEYARDLLAPEAAEHVLVSAHQTLYDLAAAIPVPEGIFEVEGWRYVIRPAESLCVETGWGPGTERYTVAEITPGGYRVGVADIQALEAFGPGAEIVGTEGRSSAGPPAPSSAGPAP
jgi:hypothetical protein